MTVDERPFPLETALASDSDPVASVLRRLAEDSQRLRDLARVHDFAMLDYLLGMVVLEAEQQRRRRRASGD